MNCQANFQFEKQDQKWVGFGCPNTLRYAINP